MTKQKSSSRNIKREDEEADNNDDLFKKVTSTLQIILDDRSSINSLLEILDIFLKESKYEILQISSEAIFKVLKLLVEESSIRLGHAVSSSDENSSNTLMNWMNSIYEKFLQRSFMMMDDKGLEEIGFNNVIQVIRLLSCGNPADFSFPLNVLTEILEKIISKEINETSLYELFDEAVNSYRDLRYYSLRVLGRLAEKTRGEVASEKSALIYKRIFKILSEIVMENEAEISSGKAEINPFLVDCALPSALSSTKGHLQEFSSCWLEFIQGISIHAPELHRSILLIINERVIPYMMKPTLLADYMTDSYNAGGLVSLLALNGLFTLMHMHNLDYPSFFTKLYGLLDDKIFHCRYRKRFCRLFGIFMTSTHMPAYLVAAFVKRVSRLSLDSSPAVISWVIPFVYNLFKAHPEIRVLIQRKANGTDPIRSDPFVMEEIDPAKCKAIDSSIWEIHALQRHYWNGAVKQSRLFNERLTKPSFNLDDYLEGPTYNNMIHEELGHKWTKVPPLNIKISETIF